MGVGGAVGLLSGLLGIGGGILIVPFLYVVMAGPEWSGLHVPGGQEAQLAHATSLALIVPTAASGLWSYHRQRLATWATILPLGLAAGAFALAGSHVAALLPSILLKVAFGLFLLVMAWRIGRDRSGRGSEWADDADPRAGIRWQGAVAGGGLVGFLSALLGVGGGVVAIPVLIHWARLDLHRVAAASLGVIVFAALAGTAGYAWAGAGVEGLPPGSLGFVHLPLWAAMLPGAVLLAPLGARWNRALPTATLRRLFGILLLVMGVYLVWDNGSALLGGLG